MLALVSAAFAGNAGASAGRIDFSIGGVVATRPDGRQRPLVKGDELESGDTIRTNDGRAQIRFPDGAYVSLQPNTVFGVKEYRYDGKPDGSERGLFSLLKGAMRAVTGLIGRVHRNAFAITTPTATVGIRGTGGLIAVLPDGSTLIRGSSGIWSLSNASGTIDVPAGTSGLAPANPGQPPQQTAAQPSVPPAPPGTGGSGFVAGDQRTSTGDPVVPPVPVTPVVPPVVPLASGSGYATSVAYGVSGDGTIGVLDSGASASAIFNSSGQLTQVSFSGNTYQQVSGTQTEFDTDGILAWGRWTGTAAVPGAISSTEPYSADQGLHYVIGSPTPTLPTTGSATYTLLGATKPTYVNANTAPGTFSGSIDVAFGALPSVTIKNFTVAMPDQTYALKDASTSVSGSSFALSTTANSTSVCSGGCSADVSGFFAGVNAERIGVGYVIIPGYYGPYTNSVVGAAAFKK